MRVRRLGDNPIIHAGTPGLEGPAGENINGPCVIAAPSWLADPPGRFFLYFAHHGGEYIRLAVADDPSGPWRVVPGGVLSLNDTPCVSHVASPDVHVDADRREVRMYYHGSVAGGGQESFLAFSDDGLRFTHHAGPLAPFYLRAFQQGGEWFGLAKWGNALGILLRGGDGRSRFQPGLLHLPRVRHVALQRIGPTTLAVYYSRAGDCPERILRAEMSTKGPWQQWKPSGRADVLRPAMRWEGADEPLVASCWGAARGFANQLRDPFLFEHDGRCYLFYAGGGESALGVAEILTGEPAG